MATSEIASKYGIGMSLTKGDWDDVRANYYSGNVTLREMFFVTGLYMSQQVEDKNMVRTYLTKALNEHVPLSRVREILGAIRHNQPIPEPTYIGPEIISGSQLTVVTRYGLHTGGRDAYEILCNAEVLNYDPLAAPEYPEKIPALDAVLLQGATPPLRETLIIESPSDLC